MTASVDRDHIKGEIKSLVISAANLKGVSPDDIDPDAPLIGNDSPLGLDSIDALEIVVAIQNKYRVRVDNQNLARNVLSSITSVAEFVIRESPVFAG